MRAGAIFCAALAASLIGGSASAQVFAAYPLSPRPLPSGASIPAIASTAIVYPGCPAAPTSFGYVWRLDVVNGFTQANYAAGTGGAPLVTAIGGASGQGSAAHPWKDLTAVFGTVTGYASSPLLSTVPGSTGPIHPGDEIILATGNYGTITAGSTGQITNSPALTIAAGSGQTPVLARFVLTNSTGFVLDGTNGDFQITSTTGGTSTNLGLVDIGNNDLNAESNIVLNHLDVFSAPVATADTWTQAFWQNNAWSGIEIRANYDCASITNSHVYVTQFHNGGTIHDLASHALIQNNEVDHYGGDVVGINGSNIAILGNYSHDPILVWPADGEYFVRNNQLFTSAYQTNISVSRNKAVEAIDASIPSGLNGHLWGMLNSSGDMTNVTVFDNLFAEDACTGQDGLVVNSIHNAIVANNSVMNSANCATLVEVNTGHGGGTGPQGQPPSNVAVFNNIAGQYQTWGPNVQFYNNIATQAVGVPAWGIQSGFSLVFINATPGSVTTLAASAGCCAQDVGVNNIIDGKGAVNEFTAVPAHAVFPMTPQPNWTLLAGSPAKTMGGAVLIPPITDFNGVPFAPPYSIGGLN